MPQRSPLIFWLLLAATISVDVVLASLTADDQLSGLSHLATILYALIIGQLSVVCIWSALRTPSTAWAWIAPAGAIAIATFVGGAIALSRLQLRGSSVYWNFLGYFCLHAVVLVSLLWLLQRTSYWQRRTGVKRTWQFSLAHLLITTTLIGVLTTLIRNNIFLVQDAATNLPEAIGCIVLAAAATFVWILPWNWFLRLASTIAVGMLLAALTQLISFGPNLFVLAEMFTIIQAYYLVQALVLSIWLAVGPILPPTTLEGHVVADDTPLVSS